MTDCSESFLKGKVVDKLEAIRKIVEAKGVVVSTKIVGIRKILDSDESQARTLANAYSIPNRVIRESLGNPHGNKGRPQKRRRN